MLSLSLSFSVFACVCVELDDLSSSIAIDTPTILQRWHCLYLYRRVIITVLLQAPFSSIVAVMFVAAAAAMQAASI